jgi:drug/metabolite transporter (DMT)-like permease
MQAPAQVASASYALGAVCTWGVSDFLGGYVARRFNSFLLVTLGHLSGTILAITLALASHDAFPDPSHFAWACAGGAAGGLSLVLFYRALSQGTMGLAAPVSAVLSAAIPTAYASLTQGVAGGLPVGGFVLALAGLWLISRPEGGGKPQGLAMAAVAGLGFSFFYIFMQRAGSGSALWFAIGSRASALLVTGVITFAGRKFSPTYPRGFGLALLAGCLDVSGTILFIRAAQTGRLDTAVVVSSLYPAVTVLLARVFLKEHFTLWRAIGVLAALIAVPMIATG